MVDTIGIAIRMVEAALREVAGIRQPLPEPERWSALPSGHYVPDDDEEEEVMNEGD